MGRYGRNDDRPGVPQGTFWKVNQQRHLEKLAKNAIDAQRFRLLTNDVLTSLADLKSKVGQLVSAYNTHQHQITTGTTYTITRMEPFAAAKFKHFRVELFVSNNALTDVKVLDTDGSRTDRIGKRALRKAKKVLIPAATMWFKSGYKDQMPLEEFVKLTLKK